MGLSNVGGGDVLVYSFTKSEVLKPAYFATQCNKANF